MRPGLGHPLRSTINRFSLSRTPFSLREYSQTNNVDLEIARIARDNPSVGHDVLPPSFDNPRLPEPESTPAGDPPPDQENAPGSSSPGASAQDSSHHSG